MLGIMFSFLREETDGKQCLWIECSFLQREGITLPIRVVIQTFVQIFSLLFSTLSKVRSALAAAGPYSAIVPAR